MSSKGIHLVYRTNLEDSIGVLFIHSLSVMLHTSSATSQLPEAMTVLLCAWEVRRYGERHCRATRLVEGVGAGSPVGEEQAEPDGLEHAGEGTDGNGVHGTLLGDNLGDDLVTLVADSGLPRMQRMSMTYRRSSGSHEDQ
jgi:hypothetical protein